MTPNPSPTGTAAFDARRAARLALVLAGVAVLLVRDSYEGPHRDLVHSYAGNVAVSFAVYFMFAVSALGLTRAGARSAAAALLTVEAFEITDGFGVMSNVYDPVDLLANVVGVALAWAIDWLMLSSRADARP